MDVNASRIGEMIDREQPEQSEPTYPENWAEIRPDSWDDSWRVDVLIKTGEKPNDPPIFKALRVLDEEGEIALLVMHCFANRLDLLLDHCPSDLPDAYQGLVSVHNDLKGKHLGTALFKLAEFNLVPIENASCPRRLILDMSDGNWTQRQIPGLINFLEEQGYKVEKKYELDDGETYLIALEITTPESN